MLHLRAALDHIEGSSLAQLEADRSFLLGLTAHERTREARLESEVADYYRLVNSGRGEVPEPRSVGFNESWTFEGDREAAGSGAV